MPEKPEDVNLAREQLPKLNEKFYRSEPFEYFRRRLDSIILSSADSSKLRAAVSEGLRFGSLQISGEPEPYDFEQAKNYVALESVVLLHHVSEALFRLYFAHEKLSLCPWLEVARLRQFSLFKKKLNNFRDSLGDPEVRRSILNVFRGLHDPGKLPPEIPADRWEDDNEALFFLLETLVARLLDESNLYNAAKHGLAVIGGDVGVSLSVELPEGVEIANSGPSLTFLEVVEHQHGRDRRWSESLRWVRSESNLGLISFAITQMETLWAVARSRYLGGSYSIKWLDYSTTEMIARHGVSSDIYVEGMSATLLYYADEDSD